MQTVGLTGDLWADRRVLVTGHTGFLGGWLCLWLSRLNAKISGYALDPPTRPSLFDSVGLSNMVNSVIADIRDADRLRAALADAAPEIVIHLAAQPIVRLAHAEPADTFASNVMGTVNLLEAIRATPSVAGVIVITSDKVYDNVEWDWGYRENDRLGGREPYGASKACAELVVAAYRRSYFSGGGRIVGVATMRAGNIVGGGDWAEDRLIPDAMRAFEAGRALHIRNPRSVRPWQHVLEPARGILMLAERLLADPPAWSGAWNFGPLEHDSCPVSRIADTLARQWGDGATWINGASDGAEPYEARLLAVNSTKAAARLDWRPLWSLDRTLAATVEWYRAHAADADMRDFSMKQIAAYAGSN